MWEKYSIRIRDKQKSRLTEDDLHSILEYQYRETGNLRIRASKRVTDAELNQPYDRLTMQQKGVLFLYNFLKKNSNNIESVANIDARMDTASEFLFKKFPKNTILFNRFSAKFARN